MMRPIIEPGDLLPIGSGPMDHDERGTLRSVFASIIGATQDNDSRRMLEILSYRYKGHPVIAHIVGRLDDWYQWAAGEYGLEPGPMEKARAEGFVISPIDLLVIRDQVTAELGDALPYWSAETSDGRAGAGPLKVFYWGERELLLAFRRHSALNLWRPETAEELDRQNEGQRDPAPVKIGDRVLCPIGVGVVSGLQGPQAAVKVGDRPVEWWSLRAYQEVREEVASASDAVTTESSPAVYVEGDAAELQPEKPAESKSLEGALVGKSPELDALVAAYGQVAWIPESAEAGTTLRILCCVCRKPITKGHEYRMATHQGRGLRAHAHCFEELEAACKYAVSEGV